ncbi:hypothetical protein H5P28_00125 [Ruficoccus amylovorans]|uniref:Uncharacterized protein n=1 Tax=Ruficoccus amylovorans TaxID=1804625 RepID=A0A842HAJ4_9BACT|nr:hypothetical protein [Ruficoccus amylovorans]MBC2592657.1 hypothetical protein [Ruficoccus amylovorans]
MDIIQWIASAVLLLFGGYIAVMNWAVFVNNHVLKKQWASAIPFIGGFVLTMGIVLLPITGSWKYAWIPLLLDWGSVPVVIASLACWLSQPGERNTDKD